MDAHVPDLKSLVRSSAGGDRDSFGQLYDLTSARAFGLALSVLGDRVRAEEVTRSSMVEAWRTAPSYDASRCSVPAWLLALTHRAAVARKRDDTQGDTRDDTRGAPPGAPRPATDDDVLAMAYLGGLTHTEIDRRGHLPPGSAASQLRARLLLLREGLTQDGSGEDLLPAW